MPLFSKRFSLLQIITFSILISLVTSGSVYYVTSRKAAMTLAAASTPSYCNYNVKRMSGLKFVKPIMWVDQDCEADALAGTKKELNDIIERYKLNNGVIDASVYLRSNTDWTSVNEDVKYEPGSLFKVPILIAALKREEEQPGFLNTRVLFDKAQTINKKVAFASKSIVIGQSYSVKELLTYMIKYSDNNATQLVQHCLNKYKFQQLFSDIGLEVPNLDSNQYLINAQDYSLFMRTIFNAGYLTIPHSEFAAELLSECDFKDGIVKGIPAGTKIAHKFGESGNDKERQLHESAIVYIGNSTYLLTVMTKGKDIKQLSELIGELSRTVYNNMAAQSN